MDRLKKYGFKDKHGHPLENCVEYLTIFDEHKASLESAEAEVARQSMIAKALARKLAQATRTWGKAGNMDNSAGYWMAWAEHDADSEIKAASKAVEGK